MLIQAVKITGKWHSLVGLLAGRSQLLFLVESSSHAKLEDYRVLSILGMATFS